LFHLGSVIFVVCLVCCVGVFVSSSSLVISLYCLGHGLYTFFNCLSSLTIRVFWSLAIWVLLVFGCSGLSVSGLFCLVGHVSRLVFCRVLSCRVVCCLALVLSYPCLVPCQSLLPCLLLSYDIASCLVFIFAPSRPESAPSVRKPKSHFGERLRKVVLSFLGLVFQRQ
jgi:hypothetical protein